MRERRSWVVVVRMEKWEKNDDVCAVYSDGFFVEVGVLLVVTPFVFVF